MSETKNKWFGYLHTAGTIQAKRYWDERDTQEARESPFCQEVFGPFDAKDRDEAINIVTQLLKEQGYERKTD